MFYSVVQIAVGLLLYTCYCKESLFAGTSKLRLELQSHLSIVHSVRFVGWLLNVPATCECISGTDLL